MKDDSKYLGKMYIAKRPCGRVSASTWVDEGYEKEIAKSVARWIKRGDSVTLIDRYEGDKMPEFICKGCVGGCKSDN